MQMIVDSLDGTFELKPDPREMARIRRLAWLVVGANLGMVAIIAGLGFAMNIPALLFAALGLLLLSAASDWIIWRLLAPPVLRVDPMNLTYQAMFDRRSTSRGEIAGIRRGQVYVRSGRSSQWVRSYAVTDASGAVRMTIPSAWYRAEDFEALAGRLGVTVSGDFDQRIEPAKARG